MRAKSTLESVLIEAGSGMVDLLHVNCEGCEYELLEDLIQNDLHRKIRCLVAMIIKKKLAYKIGQRNLPVCLCQSKIKKLIITYLTRSVVFTLKPNDFWKCLFQFPYRLFHIWP